MLFCLPVPSYLFKIFFILDNVLAQSQLLRHKTHLQTFFELHLLPFTINIIAYQLFFLAFLDWQPDFLILFSPHSLPILAVFFQLALQTDAQHSL